MLKQATGSVFLTCRLILRHVFYFIEKGLTRKTRNNGQIYLHGNYGALDSEIWKEQCTVASGKVVAHKAMSTQYLSRLCPI